MKIRPSTAALLGAALLAFAATAGAEDKKSTKLNSENTKEMLDKLVGEAKKAASKMKDEDKGSTLWPRSKETLTLPRADYQSKVESAFRSMDAEIKALAEAEGPVSGRDYFKTRLESLRQQLAYCRQDADKLKASENEESFRVKQKKFDRVLVFLGEAIQLCKEEAGL